MKKIFAIIVLGLVCHAAIAQGLARKGAFGVSMKDNPNGDGVLLVKIFENSTASGLGLLPNDILTAVNGQAFNEISPLLTAIGKWKAEAPVNLSILRNEKKMILKGKVVGKPYETSKHGEVIYGEVDFDGGKLRSILELPNGVENPAVVFFLPGIGCGSLDYYYNPSATTKLFVEDLVEKGLAVYRVEKPGMGDSFGTTPCEEMDFHYEVNAFKMALKTLQGIESIDSEKIFLYGHSLGSVSAPLIAKDNQVAGIIAWGGISVSWFEYALQTLRQQRHLLNRDYVETESNFITKLPFYIDFYLNKNTPEELKNNPQYVDFAAEYFHGDMWLGIQHYSYFHSLNEVNILTAYKDAGCPVLAIGGEFDIHTVDTRWTADIANAVNFYRPGDGESLIVPKTTHHYHTVPSIAFYNQLRAEKALNGEYEAEHYNQDVALAVFNWIEKRKL